MFIYEIVYITAYGRKQNRTNTEEAQSKVLHFTHYQWPFLDRIIPFKVKMCVSE